MDINEWTNDAISVNRLLSILVAYIPAGVTLNDTTSLNDNDFNNSSIDVYNDSVPCLCEIKVVCSERPRPQRRHLRHHQEVLF